ncbi:MAG: O-antigen ligase family protein [Candidatus Omnitrophica bacterium]|nr:O-antigen ligase family protein [Candidatus Omnitrophota bacterium]
MFRLDTVSFFSYLADFFLIFLIIFTPFFYGSVTAVGYIFMESFIFLFFTLWLIKMILGGNLLFLKTNLLITLILFVFLVIIQIIPLPLKIIEFISPKIAHIYRELLPLKSKVLPFFTLSICVNSTIDFLFKILSYFLIFFLIINYIQKKEQFQILFNAIIICGFIISIFAIIQNFTYANLDKVYWFDINGSAPSCFGPFVNRNHFAGYMEMVIPLCLGYLISDIDIKRKTLYGMSLFVISLSLFLSLSRAGMVIYLLELLSMIIFLWIKKRFEEQSIIMWLSFLFILVFIFFLTDFKVIFERFFSIFEASPKESIFERGYRWQDMFKIWYDFPFLGIGGGAFSSIAPLYKRVNLQMTIVHAHNDYLELLVETGIFGFLLLSLFFYLYFSQVIKMWMKRHDRFVVGLVLGGIISNLGILIHSWVDFNLRIPANALLFFIISGLTYKLVFSIFKFNK